MAKVMISLPDGLLAQVDAAAELEGESRSAFVRDALRAKLRENVATPERKRAALERLRTIGAKYPATDGMTSVEWLRRDRDSH